MNTLNFYKKLTIAAAFFSMTLLSSQSLAQNQTIDRVVVFGASLSDTGNAFIWLSDPANRDCGTSQNVPPYDALDDTFVPDGPYAKGGHHFTNGATWVEGLASNLRLAGNVRPAFQNDGPKASNYAVGGARAITGYPCRFNLQDQLDAYLNDFPQTSPNTLITIEIGGNDVRDALIAALFGQSALPIINDALISIKDTISTLYDHGARKFLLLNVPDIGKTPAVLILNDSNPGLSIFAGQLSQTFNNDALGYLFGYPAQGGLAKIQQDMNLLPDNNVKILDISALLNDVIAQPAVHGFINTTDACVTPNQPPFKCKKPDTYVFWDGIHPTKALHAIVAQQAITAISAP